MMANAIIKTADFLGELLNKVLLVPAKMMFDISAEYMGSNGLTFTSAIGFFVVLILISFVAKYTAILIKNGVAYTVFLYKEKKRAQIREIKRKEREKTLARLADNQTFDEMYEAYAVEK